MMKVKPLRFLACAALCAVTSLAHAGTSSGLVTVLYVHSGDAVMFGAGPINNRLACSIAGDEWAFSLTTPTGRAMYALLLSAQAQGKAISVKGNGQCSAWQDREEPFVIYMTP